MKQNKYLLAEDQMPRQWYNVMADLDSPMAPGLHPGTKEPLKPEDLSPIFPMALIEQEVSDKPWWQIPEEVLDIYATWRPTPLVRARRLEKALDTPARIYFKNESVSPAGSHKPNTAAAQVFYNKQEGIKRIATETGAGQWGSSMAYVCNIFDIELTVYMVRVSYDQKPYRKAMIHTWGAEIFPSPSDQTNTGRAALAADPNNPGALGLAISEAVEDAATHEDTNYGLGSVLNHVCMHQTIIGEEAIKQMAMTGDEPDVVVGCIGGGSNFAGIAFPYIREKKNGKNVRILAVEPSSCPSVTKGEFMYDFGDCAQSAPMLKMHTLGHSFMPPGIHAGGLRYHGMAPTVSHLVKEGHIEAVSRGQLECFEAGVLFARTEGIIPAPESTHAIRGAVDEALDAREAGEERVILFNLSGHGHLDMASFETFMSGGLCNYDYPDDMVKKALGCIPPVNY